MEPLPSTDEAVSAMVALHIPADPVYLMRDHPVPRQLAELLTRLAAGTLAAATRAERLAGLGVDDRAELHRQSDVDIAGLARPGAEQPVARLLDLQTERLAWVAHTLSRLHREPDVVTALGAIIALLEARREAGTPDPLLSEAIGAFTAAADHLNRMLIARPRPACGETL